MNRVSYCPPCAEGREHAACSDPSTCLSWADPAPDLRVRVPGLDPALTVSATPAEYAAAHPSLRA